MEINSLTKIHTTANTSRMVGEMPVPCNNEVYLTGDSWMVERENILDEIAELEAFTIHLML
ncbi:hypothetical protein JXI42_00785 [bacterium]|nr:hypothetical protein [bacterium]